MSLQQETVTIGETQFRIRQLPFSPARRVFVRLSKTIVPGLMKMMEDSPSLDSFREGGGLSAGIEDLVNSVSDEDLEYFAEQFGKATEFSQTGEKWPRLTSENRETLFSGNIMLFFQWIKACIEVNYADFFSAVGAKRGDVLQEK